MPDTNKDITTAIFVCNKCSGDTHNAEGLCDECRGNTMQTAEMILKDLATSQEKLKAINTLSNNLQKIDNVKAKNDIAYLIHQIVEADYIDSTLGRQITSYSIMANKELFVLEGLL